MIRWWRRRKARSRRPDVLRYSKAIERELDKMIVDLRRQADRETRPNE